MRLDIDIMSLNIESAATSRGRRSGGLPLLLLRQPPTHQPNAQSKLIRWYQALVCSGAMIGLGLRRRLPPLGQDNIRSSEGRQRLWKQMVEGDDAHRIRLGLSAHPGGSRIVQSLAFWPAAPLRERGTERVATIVGSRLVFLMPRRGRRGLSAHRRRPRAPVNKKYTVIQPCEAQTLQPDMWRHTLPSTPTTPA